MIIISVLILLLLLYNNFLIFKIIKTMATITDFQPKLDKITETITTLTVEHTALQNTNKQLLDQVATLTSEINSLNASLTSKLSDADEQKILSELDTMAVSIESLATPSIV